MALIWTDRLHDNHYYLQFSEWHIAEWHKLSKTPAGNYKIELIDFEKTKKKAHFLEFREQKIDEFPDEQTAKNAAQNHFDKLYHDSLRHCSFAPMTNQ